MKLGAAIDRQVVMPPTNNRDSGAYLGFDGADSKHLFVIDISSNDY
jgi:hypothetical protein